MLMFRIIDSPAQSLDTVRGGDNSVTRTEVGAVLSAEDRKPGDGP
jgi:hypothetical protein